MELTELYWEERSTAAKKRLERALAEDIHVEFSFKTKGVTYARVLNAEGDREYDLALGAAGRGACSCPDFTLRCKSVGHPCKHLFMLKRSIT